MQVDDKEKGMVIYKGYYKKEEFDAWFGQNIESMIWHILKFDIKDNRMRITLIMNEINIYKSNTTYKSGGNFEEYLTNHYLVNNSSDDTKKKKTRDGERFYYAVTRAISTIASIEEFIRKASLKQNDSNDW